MEPDACGQQPSLKVELVQLSLVEITFNIRERPPKESKIQGAVEGGFCPMGPWWNFWAKEPWIFKGREG